MRGSHRVNLRRVLSIPTLRREAILFGARPPPNTAASLDPSTCSDVISSGIERDHTHPPGSINRQHLSNDLNQLQTLHAEESGSTGPNKTRKKWISRKNDSSLDTTVSNMTPQTTVTLHRINAAFEQNDIARSAATLDICKLAPSSVEAILTRDIHRNVFRLPPSRLRVWLYNLDLGTIAQSALNHIYSDMCSIEKALLADVIIATKINSGSRVKSCREAALLLKLQRTLLCRNMKSDLNMQVYKSCVDVLDIKAWRMSTEFVHLCHTLHSLWQHQYKQGNINKILQCHSLSDTSSDLSVLYSPLLPHLQKTVYDIDPNSVPTLLDLLVRISHHVPTKALVQLHEVAFLKIVELSKNMDHNCLLRSLHHLEQLDSLLTPPFYFLCERYLKTPPSSVSMKDFYLVTRCLSRCFHIDLSSLKRVLLLYRSFCQCAPTEVSILEPFVARVILRSLDISPATKNAKVEFDTVGISTNTGCNGLLNPATPSVPICRGYHSKVRRLEDIIGLLKLSLGYLRKSPDPLVVQLCDFGYLKRNHVIKSGFRIPLEMIFMS
ncbi:antitermination factor, putative [Babesia ovis]|uniref:Antitermination factor, putative n=1 Tax=Babesia ovis TaxID=5869 RepID=A0A9W5T7W1_BABOV|nr:antitermination factor, putative [Babesia ovis]